MPHKVNRNTTAQYDYIRANYRRIHVHSEDQVALKSLAKKCKVSVVDLISVLVKMPVPVVLSGIMARIGERNDKSA